MRTFAYNYVFMSEATPREEHHGMILAASEEDATFLVVAENFDNGDVVQVYNVIECEL